MSTFKKLGPDCKPDFNQQVLLGRWIVTGKKGDVGRQVIQDVVTGYLVEERRRENHTMYEFSVNDSDGSSQRDCYTHWMPIPEVPDKPIQ